MNQGKIGKFIATRRNQSNMTQEELAEKLGVNRRSISRWENGNSLPDYSILDSLCNILDISINELYYGKEIKDNDYKNLSEENLKLFINEKYRKYFLIKRMTYAGIISILIFIIVYLLFIK